MSSTIITPVQVMFFDTDAGGVVHNIAYLRFIETARTLLAVQLGMDWDCMARTSVFPVVVRTEIDYNRPGSLGGPKPSPAGLAQALAHGQDPADVARMAFEGMDAGEFIIVTNPAIRKMAEQRNAEVAQALDMADRRCR